MKILKENVSNRTVIGYQILAKQLKVSLLSHFSVTQLSFQCHSAVKYNDAVNLDETNSDDTTEHTVNIGEDNGGNVTDMEG